MADIKLSIDDLPPATTVYGADVFVIDQLGGDGYTKKITYNNLRTTLSDTFVLKAGDTMTGALILNTSTPVSALQATSKGYVDAQVVTKVSKAGDTMTGPLTLNSNAPTAALHAASRGYVQNNFLPISGIGTGEQNTGMTGFLTLCAHPISAFHAATKFYVDNRSGDGSPVGSIVYFAASAAPVGWFACSGAALNTTIFQDLFNVIGYTFGGSGDTFNLPDLRGEFLRGWDGGRGVDSSRAFGSAQADAFQGHWHELYAQAGAGAQSVNSSSNGVPNTTLPANFVRNSVTDGANGTPRTSSETRPRNVALLPCIKYATNAEVNYLGLSAQTLLNYVNSLGAQIPNPKSVAKAWVNFNGTTGTIRGSYNVSTITKFGSGRYQINFSPPLADTNYTVSALGGGSCNAYGMQDQTLTSVRVNVQRSDTDCGAYWDVDPMMVVIFGN
jgi:microcystin-dependent protein